MYEKKIKHPFKVPEGYFDDLYEAIIVVKETKVDNEKKQTVEDIKVQKANISNPISKLNSSTLKIAACISLITLLSVSIYFWESQQEQKQDVAQMINYTLENITEIAVENNISLLSENDEFLYDDILNENTLQELQDYVDNITETDANNEEEQIDSVEPYSFYDI